MKNVANDLGVSEDVVRQMEGRLSAQDMAFDGYTDDDDDLSLAPAHYLEALDADPAQILEKQDWTQDATDRLYSALSDLDDRSKDILASRWLADQKATLHELAGKYNVSAERIRQLEKNAMKKVKTALVALIEASFDEKAAVAAFFIERKMHANIGEWSNRAG